MSQCLILRMTMTTTVDSATFPFRHFRCRSTEDCTAPSLYSASNGLHLESGIVPTSFHVHVRDITQLVQWKGGWAKMPKKCHICKKIQQQFNLKPGLGNDWLLCNFVMLFCLLAPPWNIYCVSKYLRAIMNPTPPRWALPPPPPKARNTRWIFHVHDRATT